MCIYIHHIYYYAGVYIYIYIYVCVCKDSRVGTRSIARKRNRMEKETESSI